MKNHILVAAVFAGTFAAGALGGKLISPCPDLTMPACAKESLAKFKADNGYSLGLTVNKASAQGVELTLTSNFKCPAYVNVSGSLDKSALPDWPKSLENIEAAYLATTLVKLENGTANVTITPEDAPELTLIPAGAYTFTANLLNPQLNRKHNAYYHKYLQFGGIVTSKTEASFESAVTAEQYQDYIADWLILSAEMRPGAPVKGLLKKAEKAFGPYVTSKKGENTVYTFKKRLHEITADADGKVVSSKRYNHEGGL